MNEAHEGLNSEVREQVASRVCYHYKFGLTNLGSYVTSARLTSPAAMWWSLEQGLPEKNTLVSVDYDVSTLHDVNVLPLFLNVIDIKIYY